MGRKNETAFDRLELVKMSKDTDVFKLAEILMLRKPLMIDFEEYSVVESNQAIMFLSGVAYAIDGEVEVIREKVFVFATKKDLKDKTLRKALAKYKE